MHKAAHEASREMVGCRGEARTGDLRVAQGTGQRDSSVGMDGRSTEERPERTCKVLVAHMEGTVIAL